MRWRRITPTTVPFPSAGEDRRRARSGEVCWPKEATPGHSYRERLLERDRDREPTTEWEGGGGHVREARPVSASGVLVAVATARAAGHGSR